MSVSNIIINKADNGYELSFKTTDGRDQKATFVESKYGTYVLSVDGKVSQYALRGIKSIFDGGILPSDELNLRLQLVANELESDGVKVEGFSQLGGVYNAATKTLNFGTKPLVKFDASAQPQAAWNGEGKLVMTDLFVTAAVAHAGVNKVGKAYLAAGKA